MSYARALDKAWADLKQLAGGKIFSVKFLSDTYSVDAGKNEALSDSCNIPAKEYVSLITLHYIIRKLQLKELPKPCGEWVDFNALEGGEGYYPAFKKRTIDRILKKYGTAPEELMKSAGRFSSKKSDKGDAGIIIYPFDNVPIMITMYRPDEEFGPDANILYDRTISDILCTEDIVVLTEILVHQL